MAGGAISDRDEFREAVEAVLPPLVYRETHGALVLFQHADDGTIDVVCDDPRIGDLTRVPFRAGLPGALVELRDGDRVRVAFEEGDPERFYAMAPDQDATATQAVARVGDAVDCGWWVIVPFGPGYMLSRVPDPPPGLPGPPGSAHITGVNIEGSARLKLGS
jgi:hypothetical protein